jgi:hypothetical protein
MIQLKNHHGLIHKKHKTINNMICLLLTINECAFFVYNKYI